MNPFEPVATFLLGWMKQSMISTWLRFLFELAFSAAVSFLFICGSVLIAEENWPLAVGSGMIAAAVAGTVLFRKETSRLTRGMLVVLPEAEALKEVETDLQTITKKD